MITDYQGDRDRMRGLYLSILHQLQAHKWRMNNKIDTILEENCTKFVKTNIYHTNIIDWEGDPG